MQEDWGNNESSSGSNDNNGRGFGKGRGFNRNTNDRSNSDSGSGWSQDNNDSGSSWGQNNSNGDRRGRGGGRGGRGGGGGRFNRNDDDNSRSGDGNSSWGNDGGDRGGGRYNRDDNSRSDGDSWGGDSGGGRGRGGRGGGRGRSNRGNDDGDDNGSSSWGDGNKGDDNREEDENGEVKERPPIYVPVELTEDQIFDDKGITTGINFDSFENIPVTVHGDNIPPKINSFSEAGFRDVLMQNLKRCGYDKPTPIQKASIPIVMKGRDLMATAQTGSGKTGAFLLPMIHRLLSEDDSSSTDGSSCQPNAVIVSPTRELAIQIHENARRYASGSFLKIQIVYGGTAVRYQMNQLMRGCHILIATPGRLNDFVERGAISFGAIKFIVLDEADRMLDMGFRGDMEKVMNHSTMSDKSQRQTLMFSATFSEEIQRLAAAFLSNDYAFVSIGIVGGACKDVEQNFMQVARNDKKKELMTLLQQESSVEGTLLFVAQKRNADFIASFLSEKGFKTTSIHGDRFQSQREEALRDFKSRRMAILVATSVAARGLDISGVRHVINYDLPQEVEEYVHRIGRTGRLGNKGKATSFYDSSQDSNLASKLVSMLKQANQKVPDFLGDGAGGGYDSSGFGAVDFRQGDQGSQQTNNAPQAVGNDLSWD